MKKKLALLITAGALCAFLFVGNTLAWFTDTEETTNTITMGKVDIEILENGERVGEEGLEFGNEVPVVPGQSLTKKVEVENVDSVNTYVRVKLTVLLNDQEAKDIQDEVVKANVELLKEKLVIGSGWKLINGYYYFHGNVGEDVANGVVPRNGKTTPLFNEVIIPGKEWGNEMQETTLSIKIEADAIQVDNFYPLAPATFTVEGLEDAWTNQ